MSDEKSGIEGGQTGKAAGPNDSGQGAKRPDLIPLARKRLIVAMIASAAVLLLVWLLVPKNLPAGQSLGDSWVIKENQSDPVIGDLGGVPVAIPKPYANFVEYDGDPHFMEKRKAPPPTRTQDSKLASFGFEIRFPDMEPVTAKTEAAKRNATIQTTMWMRVGIDSNSHYGAAGDQSLERYFEAIADPRAHRYRYEPLPNETYGLSGFTPVGTNLSRRNLGGGGADWNDKNIYVHRGQDGRVDTYIACSNMTHSAAVCEQHFSLLPAMRIRVSVSYRKDLLPQWREIQASVTQVILGFRINPYSNNSK